ncbi:trypsin-like peptidase domain-containing protein [Pseudonocardia sp. NPDC049635]|uniref:nSTAND1 domain-containing NTPase n=1 Tax=Pseudonocardia sp. NPDC049635 TaxID=3155506 RepID=UPI00340607B8
MTETGLGWRVQFSAVARVVRPSGEVVGSGVLVGPNLVATCAHVVTAACGAGVDAAYRDTPPDGQVAIEFPLVDPADCRGIRSATVLRWVPITESGTGDVAILRLGQDAPAGVRLPPFLRPDKLWDHRFRVFGFPAGTGDGVWTVGRFRAEQGTGWVQLQTDLGQPAITEGFSGAAVWDEDSHAVVGIVVASSLDAASGTAYLIPVADVLGLDPGLLPNPYRGLEPFHEEHAEYFFGRADDIARLEATLDRAGAAVLVGPSGSGKSSLVRAGLIPRHRARGRHIVDCTHTDSDLLPELDAMSAEGRPVTVVLDQFEELVALDPPAARRRLQRLLERVGTDLALIVTLRSGSLDQLLTPELADVIGAATVLVPPMGREQLRQAVTGPAERAPGLLFEDGLVDRILDDTGDEPGRLPLLGQLLDRLWENREGARLTLEGYRAAGGVAGSISQHAEQVVADLGEGSIDPLRRLLTRMVTADREGGFQRRSVAPADLDDTELHLLDRLLAARLVVAGTSEDGRATVELAHQALIEHWPRLAAWLAEDQDFLVWRTRTHEAWENWQDQDLDETALLQGGALAAGLDWVRRRPGQIPDRLHDYVRRGEARQRRSVRRWRAIASVLAVLVVLAASLAVVAGERGSRLDNQLRSANAELLGRLAIARAATDPDAATQFALQAYRSDPDNPAARDALSARYNAMATTVRQHTVSDVPIQAFSGDREVLLLRTDDGLHVVHDVAGPSPRVVTLPGTPRRVSALLSPDRRWIAAIDPGGSVYLWEVTDLREPTILHAGSDVWPVEFTGALAFSDDGAQLSFAPPGTGEPRELVTWQLPDLTPVPNAVTIDAADPSVTGLLHIKDSGVFLIKEADDEPSVGAAGEMTVRSATTGAVLRSMPGDSVVVGEFEVGCAESMIDGERRTEAILRQLATRDEVRRLAVEFGDRAMCLDGRWSTPPIPLLGDSLMFRQAEVGRPGAPEEVTPVRIVSLSDDDTSFAQLTLHATDIDWQSSWALSPIVERDDSGAITLLTAQGRAISIVRTDRQPTIPAELDPQVRPTLARTIVGGHLAIPHTGSTLFIDPATGSLVAEGAGVTLYESGAFRFGRDASGDWRFEKLALPTLHPEYVVTVPGSRDPMENTGLAASIDGEFTAIAGGVVSTWTMQGGDLVRPPATLPPREGDPTWYKRVASIEARPGHSGQVAIRTPDGAVELWDVREDPRQLFRIDANLNSDGSHHLFDASGERLVTSSVGGELRVWSAETGEQLGAPIPTPGIGQLLTISADGRLIVEGLSSNSIEFWDLELGARSGRLDPGHQLASNQDVTGEQLQFLTRHGSYSLAATGQAWFDHVCSIAGREPTADETRAFPPGTDQSSPCT